jgi:hypothetical protein
MYLPSLCRSIALAASLFPLAFSSLQAQDTVAASSIIQNSDMESDADGDNWPDGWPQLKAGGSWTNEKGNHFLRLTSSQSNTTTALRRDITLPANTDSIALGWRQRITGLKSTDRPSGEVRISIEFFDANGSKLPGNHPSPLYRTDSAGWETKLGRIPVPSGTNTVRITPTLANIASGSYDLDNFTVIPTVSAALVAQAAPPAAPPTTQPPAAPLASDPARKAPRTELPAKGPPPIETARKEYWPSELRVQGNRLVSVADGREVWLQGVNVPSLDWSIRGESIERAIITAIQDWNANVIRLPIKSDPWFGKGIKKITQTDGGASYRELIDQAIMLAANRGAYVVLDLHQYRAARPEYLTFWTEAANRYKNHPAVIFDLLNEPHGTTWEIWRDGGFIEEKKKDGDEDAFLTAEEKLHNKHGFQSPGMQKMLDTVRATGAKNIVVAGGLDYAYNLAGITEGFALTDRSGNGIMYASHVYPWKKNWQKRFLDAAAKHPILLGEVGADSSKMKFIPANAQENAATWVPAMLGLIQKHRLNWTGWAFHSSASPRMLADWNYTPTPFWGQPAKDALAGKKFPEPDRLR